MFVPGRPDVSAIKSALDANGAHALAFDLRDDGKGGFRGHLVWLPPASDVTVERIQVPSSLAQGFRQVCGGSPLSHSGLLRRLAEIFVPDSLRDLLINAAQIDVPLPLVIIPSESLFGLPFAALPLGQSHLLVHGALLHYSPTFSLFATATGLEQSERTGTVAHFDLSLETNASAQPLMT